MPFVKCSEGASSSFHYSQLFVHCSQHFFALKVATSSFVTTEGSSKVTTNVAEFSEIKLLEEALRKKDYKGKYWHLQKLCIDVVCDIKWQKWNQGVSILLIRSIVNKQVLVNPWRILSFYYKTWIFKFQYKVLLNGILQHQLYCLRGRNLAYAITCIIFLYFLWDWQFICIQVWRLLVPLTRIGMKYSKIRCLYTISVD